VLFGVRRADAQAALTSRWQICKVRPVQHVLTVLISATLFGGMLGACAGLDTRLPDISMDDLRAEREVQERAAMELRDRHVAQLIETGWPILRDNAALCPKTRPSLGLLTHSDASYDKRLRLAALRELGANETPRIHHIATDSPADRAGLRSGDILETAEGKPLAYGSKAYEALLALEEPVANVRRNGQLIRVPLAPVPACDYDLRLSSSAQVNAYADGRHITVTSGMMEFVETPDELALILGHELGHNTMGHIRKVIGNLLLSGLATRYTRPFESEADYVGLYYSVRAGYSAEGVEAFWRRLAKLSSKNINRAKTHPTFPDRFVRLAAARAEIAAKQAADQPLIPNFKTDGETPSDS